MQETKLIKLLSNFPVDDWKRFRDFLASPLFNRDAGVMELYSFLADAQPRIPSVAEVCTHLFPNDPGNPETKLNRLKTRLVSLIREYVDFQSRYREDDRLVHALARCEAWWERGEDHLHQQEIAALHTELQRPDNLDGFRDLRKYQLASHVIGRAPHYARKSMLSQLQEAFFSLDAFQKVQKLRYLCFLSNQARFSGDPTPEWLANEFAQAPDLCLPEAPMSQLYFACFQALQHPDETAYRTAFRAQLDQLEPQLSREAAQELYQYVLNFHIRDFNRQQNNPAILQAIQELYELLLDKEILLEKGSISAWNYKNIVSIMARGGDLAWLDRFMNAYEGRIRFDYAGNAAHFCRGLVAFYQGNFGETVRRMELVLQSFRNVFWGLEARSLLLQAYFEQDDAAGIKATYDSIRMYLDRKAKSEVSEDYQRGYANFFKLLYKLHSIVTGDQDKKARKLNRLQKSISETLPLPNKKWLLGKLVSLKG